MPRARSSTKTTGENHQYQQSCTSASLISAASLSDDHSHPHECCHPTTREAPCGTARYWEAFAGQQQLGVSRNQYVLQWREAEPSSGPPPPWHKGIWNVDQEQSSPLIKACFVQWKMCNIGFTSWIPNCLAIFPSASQIYWSARAWLSLYCLSDWHITQSWRLASFITAVSEGRVSSCVHTHWSSSTSTCTSAGQLISTDPSPASLYFAVLGASFLSCSFQKPDSSITNPPKHSDWSYTHLWNMDVGKPPLSASPGLTTVRGTGGVHSHHHWRWEIPSSSWQTVVCWLYIRATSAQQRDQLVSQRGKEKSKGGSFSLGAKPRWSTTLLPTQIFGPYTLPLL